MGVWLAFGAGALLGLFGGFFLMGAFTLDRNMAAAQRCNMVQAARCIFREAFHHDPSFRQTYVDNVSCVLMDSGAPYENKDFRDWVSSSILDRLFGEEHTEDFSKELMEVHAWKRNHCTRD